MTVGWYVHHHGSGHLQRFLTLRRRVPAIVGLSSLPCPAEVAADGWVTLPPDWPADDLARPQAGGALHWAPQHHAGLRERMAALAAWIAAARPSVFVCDVSVEVAAFVRLMGVPVVWIAQRGRRTDDPHRLAYRACTVVAPWTAALDSPDAGLPGDVLHLGALSRFDGRASAPPPGVRRVTVLLGRGGHSIAAEQLHAAAQATPDWTWTVAGMDRAPGEPVIDAGCPPDPWPLLCEADVVVGSGGGNLIAEVAAARRAFVCLPQARPFDEQADAAAALRRTDLAEAFDEWPAPARWPGILRRAAGRDPERWALLHDGRAAERLERVIRVSCPVRHIRCAGSGWMGVAEVRP